MAITASDLGDTKAPGTPDVTVVVPAYNAESTLTRCIESVCERQDTNFRIEVLVIDDGSTDSTPAVLHELSGRFPTLRSVRQENSGWAGSPRNRGLDAATGRYVLFLDADDRLAEGALESLVEFADRNSCDIIAARVEGLNRPIHQDVYAETQLDGDIRRLIRSNSVLKLFRTGFLRAHGLRFPEEKVRLEDAIFTFTAYALSARTSILADRTYYFAYLHEGASHILRSSIDPVGYSESVDRSLAALRFGPWPANELAEAEADFFRRTVLTRYNVKFPERNVQKQRAWIRSNSHLADKYVSTRTALDHYGPVNRSRLWGLRAGDPQAMLAVSRKSTKQKPLVFARAIAVSVVPGLIRIVGTVTPAWGIDTVASVHLEARAPSGHVVRRVDASTRTGETDELLGHGVVEFTAHFPLRTLMGRGTLRLYAIAVNEEGREVSARLSTGSARLPRPNGLLGTVTWSSTRFDGLSIRVHLPGADVRRVTGKVLDAAAHVLRGARESEPLRRLTGLRPPGDGMLPEGRILAMTWSIPREFGGLTNVLLHRSRLFVEHGAREIDILTLAAGFDIEAATKQLEADGKLVPGMRLRNLWHELRGMGDDELLRLDGADPSAPPGPVPHDLEAVEADHRVEYRSPDGSRVVRTEHFRDDGTLLLVDMRDGATRRLTLFDRSRTPVREWSAPRGLYFAWLDSIIGRELTFLISDSKAVGRFLFEYRRDHVVVVQAFHSTHIDARASTVYGPLTPYHYGMLRSLAQFDLVVPLTEAQRRDMERALGPGANLAAIPNSRTAPPVDLGRARDTGKGIVVGRLDEAKRVDHAMKAAMDPSLTREVHLDVIGSGPDEERLLSVREEIGAGDRIALRGYVPNAGHEFLNASFSVLCSRYEGMPLVLVESMAAGCIPISYDIRYGPSDIITDGVDGFLVPDGDIAALAAVIERVTTMPDAELDRMRIAAIQRAEDFSDDVLTRRWGQALRRAQKRKQILSRTAVPPRSENVVADIRLDRDRGSVVSGTLKMESSPRTVQLALSAVARKKQPIAFRVPLKLSGSHGGPVAFRAELPPLDELEKLPGAVLDLYIHGIHERTGTGTRVPAPVSLVEEHAGRIRVYATVKGNLSIEILPEPTE